MTTIFFIYSIAKSRVNNFFSLYVFAQEILFCVIGWRAVWCWDQSVIKHLVNHNNNLITPAEMGEGEQTQFILLNILLSNFLQNDDFH